MPPVGSARQSGTRMRVTSLLRRECCWNSALHHGRDDHHEFGGDGGDGGGGGGGDGGGGGGKGGSDSGDRRIGCCSGMGSRQDGVLLSTRYPRQMGIAQVTAAAYVSGKPVPTKMGSRTRRCLQTSGVGAAGRSG